jgi:spermidine synthase
LYVVLLVLTGTGLSYELALGAVESFLLGDPIVHFALIISGYMAALGVGAYLSGWIQRRLEVCFVDAAIATAAIGGTSAPALYLVFGLQGPFRLVLYAATLFIGCLVGLQLPVLMRILKRSERFVDVVARGFAFDYAGALAGSLGFSFLLMPTLGLVRTTLTLGLFNLAAAAYVMASLGREQKGMRLRAVVSVGVMAVLLLLWRWASHIEAITERPL